MARLGHYELVREIGGGGMSTVYEAIDERLGRTVALKVLTLPPYLTQEQAALLIERLKREARAAGRLTHPNIVTVYDVGEEDGHHYIAMEYLNGPTLRARLDKGPLTHHEAARILDGVAEALDAAHAEGVLHRDIKPGNVILLPDGRVKLADFGVARRLEDATLTQAGAVVGSPAYMAPEQVRGEPGSPASDRWSLGVLLYEMLAGHPPFGGGNVAAVLHQVVYEVAPALSGVSPDLQAVIDRALAKEPSARYGSSHELSDAFQRAVAAPAGGGSTTAGLSIGRHPGVEPAESGVKGGEVAAPRPARRSERPLWLGAPVLLAALAAAGLWLRGASFVSPPTANLRLHRPADRAAARPPARPASRSAPPVVVTEVKPQRAAVGSGPLHVPARKPFRARSLPIRRIVESTPASVPRPRVRSAAREKARGNARNPQILARGLEADTLPRHRRRPAPAVGGYPAGRDESPVRLETAPVHPVRARRARPAAAALARSKLGDRPWHVYSAAALNARAYRLQREGRQAEAEPLLREAVKRDPSHAYAQYNLGVSLLSQGKVREALEPLHRTAAQQPARWEPQQRLGQAYERLGDEEQARAAYARARALRSRRRAAPRGRQGMRRAEMEPTP